MTLAIILTMGLNAFAQYDEDKFGIQPWFGSSLLGRDGGSGPTDEGAPLILPNGHGFDTDQNTPLGTGIVLLTALGTAYLVAKKRRDE